jgi:hypothetical protein
MGDHKLNWFEISWAADVNVSRKLGPAGHGV